MRAAILHAHGEVPEVGEFDDPAPGDGAEVLDVLAGAMNPVDVRIASGGFANERHEPPYVAGKEGVGRRPDGSLVYFDASREPFGAFAERTVIDAGGGYPLPDGLEPELAVPLGVSGLAAWVGLEWRGGLQPGETVLVLGASGVVGQIAVRAAKLMGAGRVVAAARDEQALARAGGLGADALVRLGDAQPDDLAGALREAAGGAGFDLVLDPLWGEPVKAAIVATAPFGRIVNLGQSAGAEGTLASAPIRSKPVDIRGYTNYTAPPDVLAAAYDRMARHAAAGELRVEIERLGLDDVPDVWARQATSPHRKLVIVP
jgi:NADPH2:quinone reductase